jgi:hypothetical protein
VLGRQVHAQPLAGGQALRRVDDQRHLGAATSTQARTPVPV